MTKPEDFQLIYMTVASEEEGLNIVKALLEKKLIACANIFPPVRSLYLWKNKVEDNQELVVMMKSQTHLFSQLKETVLGLHSYSCPCLVALPLAEGHSVFLNWIRSSTTL